MRQLLRITFIMTFLSLSSSIRAELLVVKKTSEGFVPLSLEDDKAASPKIAAILLKYQWPMCIASNLTKEEQDELFTPGKPYAEELFIQKKIREALGSDDYCVVFVPTALYEMFCIREFLKVEKDTSFWKVVVEMGAFAFKKLIGGNSIDLYSIIKNEKNVSPSEIRKQIAEVFNETNKKFFGGEISVSFYINHLMVKYLLEKLSVEKIPTLKHVADALGLSESIQKITEELISQLIVDLKKTDLNVFGKQVGINFDWSWYGVVLKERFEKVSTKMNDVGIDLISNVFSLEYEARKLNKALILRGTGFEKFQISRFDWKERVLMGSVLSSDEKTDFLESYSKKKKEPRSLSFGNSLFAGALGDTWATVYNYLNKSKAKRFRYYGSLDPDTILGFAVLIDKKSYMQHQINNLFYIPSLAPIAALFASGGYFHARTKVAVESKGKYFQIIGIMGGELEDPTGVIVIIRDPLRHAELFSNYLAENGRFITDIFLSEEDIRFMKEATQSQKEAARFYKTIRLITPKLKSYTKKLKERVREKKEKAAPVAQVASEAKQEATEGK